MPVIAMLMLFLTPFLLEMPPWLLNHDPESKQAIEVVQKLYGFCYNDKVDSKIEYFFVANDAAKGLSSGDEEYPVAKKKDNVLIALLKDKSIRPLIILMLVLQGLQKFSGINTV